MDYLSNFDTTRPRPAPLDGLRRILALLGLVEMPQPVLVVARARPLGSITVGHRSKAYSDCQ